MCADEIGNENASRKSRDRVGKRPVGEAVEQVSKWEMKAACRYRALPVQVYRGARGTAAPTAAGFNTPQQAV
jgi:hypothetical protein